MPNLATFWLFQDEISKKLNINMQKKYFIDKAETAMLSDDEFFELAERHVHLYRI